MDKKLLSEGDGIIKIYVVTYNTLVIDFILEYISPRPWYCIQAKAFVGQYIPVFSHVH